MPSERFNALVQAVVALSESDSWNLAVREWAVVRLEEDPSASGVCVCGKTGLSKLFTLRNEFNESLLHPIGSVCVNQFGRHELDSEVALLSDLHALRSAIKNRENVTLESGHFSRALLEYFYTEGAFTPDEYNKGNGGNDYDFLLKMFNKRKKHDINARQRSKMALLLRRKVFPFVLNDERLS
jgi:hypothetical protein